MTRVDKSLLQEEPVYGPSSSVNNRIAVFDGDTGKLIKDGGTTIEEILSNSGPEKATVNEAIAATDDENYMTAFLVRQQINSLFGVEPAISRFVAANSQIRRQYAGLDVISGATGVSGGPAGGPGRVFAMDTVSRRIRQNGFIRTVKYSLLNLGSGTALVDAVRFLVLRANGTSYTQVSQSEIITPAATTALQTVNLTTPMACEPGDIIGIFMKSHATGVSLRAGTVSGETTRYIVSGPDVTVDTWVTESNLALDIRYEGAPPFAVATGDSIQEGHNTASNWHSFYHLGPAGNLGAVPMNRMRNFLSSTFEYQNFAEGSTNWSQTLAKIPAIVAVGPKMILAGSGVNDIVQNRTWEQVLADLNAIKAALPTGMYLFIPEMLPYTPGTDAQAATIRSWNANYASWCAANGAYLIPVFDAMGQVRPSTGQKDDLISAYHSDGGHLSTAGVNAYGELLANGIKSILWL